MTTTITGTITNTNVNTNANAQTFGFAIGNLTSNGTALPGSAMINGTIANATTQQQADLAVGASVTITATAPTTPPA